MFLITPCNTVLAFTEERVQVAGNNIATGPFYEDPNSTALLQRTGTYYSTLFTVTENVQVQESGCRLPNGFKCPCI